VAGSITIRPRCGQSPQNRSVFARLHCLEGVHIPSQDVDLDHVAGLLFEPPVCSPVAMLTIAGVDFGRPAVQNNPFIFSPY